VQKGKKMSEKFSFCETAVATPYSSWHIRKLTDKGKFLSGGADTPSLCGIKVAWDLNVPLNPFHLEKKACKKCKEALESLK